MGMRSSLGGQGEDHWVGGQGTDESRVGYSETLTGTKSASPAAAPVTPGRCCLGAAPVAAGGVAGSGIIVSPPSTLKHSRCMQLNRTKEPPSHPQPPPPELLAQAKNSLGEPGYLVPAQQEEVHGCPVEAMPLAEPGQQLLDGQPGPDQHHTGRAIWELHAAVWEPTVPFSCWNPAGVRLQKEMR